MTTAIEHTKTLLRRATLPKDVVDYLVRYSTFGPEDPPREVRAARSLAESLYYQVAIDPCWGPAPLVYTPGKSYSDMSADEGEDLDDDLDDDPIITGNNIITDEHAVALGVSKYRGWPHLPPDMPWPKDLHFGAQLNLTELARVDGSGRLPQDGMLYIFYNASLEAQVTHWRGPIEQLERRPYPARSAFSGDKYDYDEFRTGELILLQPHWLLMESEIPDALFAELQEAISDILGAPLTVYDCIHRLYGQRFDYHGEYEPRGLVVLDEDLLDADDETLFAAHAQQLEQEEEEENDKLVIFHDELIDAAVHIRCSSEAAARGDFSAVEVTASCT